MIEKFISFAAKAAVLAAGVILAMEVLDRFRRHRSARYITTQIFTD